ncbi:MAG TPA: ribosome silencing factor [Firmicutes bacterium]|nr:ribosome silencing factor [Bacillota bacterium]
MLEKKAQDVVLLETGKVSIIADYFLIGTGISRVQIQAICDHLRRQIKEIGFSPLRIEGYREGSWVLMDYGSLVIHLFQPQAREFYNLERLWGRALLVERF